jgi:hypothetical protein
MSGDIVAGRHGRPWSVLEEVPADSAMAALDTYVRESATPRR